MTARTQLPAGAPEPATRHPGRWLPSSRYRHPGDVIRLIAGGLVLTGILAAVAVAAAAGHGSWLAGPVFPGPALLAVTAAAVVSVTPWLSSPWRMTAWIALAAAGAVLISTGTARPAEVILALMAGVTAGAGLLVAFGVPDRRMGPDGIAAALRSAGLPVTSVEPAGVEVRAPGRSSRSPAPGSGCSSRRSARISGTRTCCTGRTGSPGCAMSAITGLRARSSRGSSTRPSSPCWLAGQASASRGSTR